MSEYYANIKYAQTSEKVSATFVETSLALHSGALAVPEVRDICFAFDKLPMNPMDSIYKYVEVARACGKKQS